MNTAETLRERLVVLGFCPVKETGENSPPEFFFNKQIVEIELEKGMEPGDLLRKVNFLICK